MDNKEKLEEAKRLYETANADQRYVLERIFPELKESEDERIRKDCLKYLDWEYRRCSYDEDKIKIEKCMAWLEKQGEQKPAWSEDDEKLVKNLISTLSNLYARNLIEKETKEKYTNWLKFLRPQPKQEWSEEDENFLKTALWHISHSISNGKSTDFHCDITYWLKFLKYRVQPRSQWKPSDEQMKALWDSIPENVMEISEREMLLNELYKDLKKL